MTFAVLFVVVGNKSKKEKIPGYVFPHTPTRRGPLSFDWKLPADS